MSKMLLMRNPMKEEEWTNKMINMELKIGEYVIPENLTAKIEGRTLQVYERKDRKLRTDEPRCKNCIHYVGGKTTYGYWSTMVCDAKPKTVKYKPPKEFENMKIYYGANPYDMPCEKYERVKP